MFKQANKKKEFAPHEIEEIDEAIQNLIPFIDYKQKAMSTN